MSKIKTYVITLSKVFPKGHPKEGEKTFFKEGINNGINGDPNKYEYQHFKIHTIRANYELWKKRSAEINSGNAILSIRQWEGKPYRSKQIELMQLTKLGIQHISMHKLNPNKIYYQIDGKACGKPLSTIAINDHLDIEDFIRWFFPDPTKSDILFEGAIIHFTDFRY